MQAILGVSTLKMVGEVSDRVESLPLKDACMADPDSPLGCGRQRQGKRIVVDYTGRGEANVDALAVLVGIGEEQIGINLIPSEDVKRFLDLRKSPDNLPILQRACRVHVHVTGKHVFGEEVEGILVLNDVPVLADIGEDCSRITAYQDFLAGGDVLTVVGGIGSGFMPGMCGI